MEPLFQRYAVYYAPDSGSPLAAFGREWLGVDAETKTSLPAPSPYVESPRRYGFHATLKAPMRLAEGMPYARFREAVSGLARSLTQVELGELKAKRIGRFLALTTDERHHGKVAELAWNCVTELDEFRAQLNDQERARRPNLTPAQSDNFERWGYPYVGDEFRFHMTLTSALEADEMDKAFALLGSRVPQAHSRIDTICIFGDPGGLKPFELVERFPLKG